MYENITPGERLQRIARLLVKAMYLSMDGQEPDASGGTRRAGLPDGEETGYRSMRLAEVVGQQEWE